MLVRSVASGDLVTVRPDEDLSEALKLMASYQVRRLPVVDDDNHLVGVLAQADVVAAPGRRLLGRWSKRSRRRHQARESRFVPLAAVEGAAQVAPSAPRSSRRQMEARNASRPRTSVERAVSREGCHEGRDDGCEPIGRTSREHRGTLSSGARLNPWDSCMPVDSLGQSRLRPRPPLEPEAGVMSEAALVTGAAGGIGSAFATRLAERGMALCSMSPGIA